MQRNKVIAWSIAALTVSLSGAYATVLPMCFDPPPPEQVIAHTNLYWTYQTAPGRTAGTVAASEVNFLPPGSLE